MIEEMVAVPRIRRCQGLPQTEVGKVTRTLRGLVHRVQTIHL